MHILPNVIFHLLNSFTDKNQKITNNQTIHNRFLSLKENILFLNHVAISDIFRKVLIERTLTYSMRLANYLLENIFYSPKNILNISNSPYINIPLFIKLSHMS